MSPVVSVIIATYNRSSVLRYAIRSVLDSTLADWELIVVGDHCTDDTEACVAAFADPRIRFENLPRNSGDQSAPNNRGVELAQGRYVAFLNHDDLYLPDHLEVAVRALEQGRADLVWVPCALALARPGHVPAGVPCAFALAAGPGPRGYTPFQHYPASAWVLRRELAQRVGRWERPDEVFVTPGQSWIFRAQRVGKCEFLPHISVICLFGSSRANAYRAGDSEHARIYGWMRTDVKYREHLYEAAAIGALANDIAHGVHHAPWRHLVRFGLRPIYAVLRYFGVHPRSGNQALLHWRRGGMIGKNRKFTGAG